MTNPDTQSTVEAEERERDFAWFRSHIELTVLLGGTEDGRRLTRIAKLAALAAQPRDDVREFLKAGVKRADDNPTMRLSILRYTISTAIEALSTDSGPTEEQAASDGVEGIARRIEYILDTSASMRNRIHRRSHLTDHDLRTILTRLRTPDERDRALESWLAHEAKHGAEECRKAEAGDDEPFWRRYWAGYAKAFETMAEKARALKGPTQ